MIIPRILKVLSTVAVGALVLSGCGSSGSQSGSGSPSSASEGRGGGKDGGRKEVSSLRPRVVIGYDGGVLTMDGATGKVLATTKHDGFLRLNPAGNGRHVLVSDGDRFRLFDAGLVSVPHEDHFHYYTQTPKLTGAEIKAPKAGHVVVNHGKTALFSDGQGTAQVLKSDAFTDGKITADEITTIKTGAPHHGVAVPLADGGVLTTKGTEQERHTVQKVDASGKAVAESADCPGVHGEAAAKSDGDGDVVSFGCTNGPLVYRDGAFHKVAVPEAYQRSGNQAGSPASPVNLTDYKVDKDAKPERPTKVGLLNTESATITAVELGSSYWFRSLARGKNGESLVLTYDGKLNILDSGTGHVLRKVDVVKPWREKENWQEPGPNVKAVGDYAYVTEPATKKLHMIQISTGELLNSWDLPVTPNEMAVVNGSPESPAK